MLHASVIMQSVLVCVCLSVFRASMSPNLFRNASFIYMNSFILAFGVWAIIAADSVDAIFMVSVDSAVNLG